MIWELKLSICAFTFTFNIKDERLEGIPGVVKDNVEIQVEGTKLVL